MAIPFNVIPNAGLRVPLFYAEINGAQTPFVSISRLLLLGQKLADGSAASGVPVFVQGDPKVLFGQHAMLVDMVNKARANAPFQEIWALPMDDLEAGVQATGSAKVGVIAIEVRAASTANIADLAAGAPSTLDGVTLAAGDTVLLRNQTTGGQNGIYTVTTLGTGANGTWTRHTDFDLAGDFSQGMIIKVLEGAQAGSKFELTTTGAIVLGTTVLTFTAYTGAAMLVRNASTLSVWIGEVQVQSVVYTTDTSQTLATRLAAAINAKVGCPVTAAIAGATPSKVDLTARHKGTAGNTIWLDTDYYGTEGPVSAALLTFVQMSGGSGDPDFTSALADLSDEPFDWIVGPYTDGTNFAAIETFLNPVSGRWSPYQQIYGHYLGVSFDTVSNLMTQGSLWNSPCTSIFGVYRSASPSWCWAGALGGRMAAHLSQAPELSRPLQTLDLIGILPPKLPENRPNITERNSLYHSGIGCYHVTGRTRIASIDRVPTNYRTNEWGVADASWLDVETRGQAMWSIRGLKAAVTGQYGRAALMDDNPDGLEGVATERELKAVCIHEYKRQNRLGVVENPDVFANSLIVQRSEQDPNRVDFWLPSDVVNQLRIAAVNYTMFLQRAA